MQEFMIRYGDSGAFEEVVQELILRWGEIHGFAIDQLLMSSAVNGETR